MQILNQDIEFLEENRTCSYFDDNISDMRYKYMYSCSESQYQGMLERGWRRFGRMHFVPECKLCNKCISMRIDVANYKFSKSEKRVIAKNKVDTKGLNFDLVIPSSLIIKKITKINAIPHIADNNLVENAERPNIAINGTLKYM